MRSNEVSDDPSGESDSKILPDKSSSDQVSSGQKDSRKVTKKLEVSNSNK